MAEQAAPAPFFNPHEPPPDFAQPPADDRLTQIITKLAQFASRNGPGFVDVIRQKQAGNADYDFLSGGEGAAYWRWYLYCTLYNLPPEQELVPQFVAPAEPSAIEQLPAEVRNGFAQVLAALTGSKESIKASKEWFMACEPHAAGMAAQMADFLSSAPTHEQRLHVLYLANDVLLKGLAQRAGGVTEESDHIVQAFKPVLLQMLSTLSTKADQAPDVVQRLTSIVNFWGERKVFSPVTVAAFMSAVTSPGMTPSLAVPAPAAAAAPQEVKQERPPESKWGPPPPGAPAAAYSSSAPFAEPPHQSYAPPPYAGQPQTQWDVQHQQQQQHMQSMPQHASYPPPDAMSMSPGWGVPPPHMQAPPAGSAPWGMPPGPAQPQPHPSMALPPPGVPPGMPPAAFNYPPPNPMLAPPPDLAAKVPHDPMSFPPGLIPQLVREKNVTDPPYSPLSPLDIEALGLPPSTPPDAYLASRLEKFYAELQDYRPGMTRSEMEDEQRQQRIRDGLDPDPDLAAKASRRSSGAADDGSYSRPGRSSRDEPKAAGLGYASSPPRSQGGEADPYDSYRRQRADTYHELLARDRTREEAPSTAGRRRKSRFDV
ncbi:g5604 [Coccomyxa viridis]|uniref:G5604 protein n=1 Tax=Coccomyxa viridis TaxID=1274662 RepID=A0ABP1FVI6_9CHLO